MIKNLEITIGGDASAHERARAKLMDLPGIEQAVMDKHVLKVAYDPGETNCATIIENIEAVGLIPVFNWYQRLCLGLRCYRETVLKEDLNNEIGWNSCLREIYVSRYRHRRHGRRDDRPRHWRQYTAVPPVD